MSEFEAIQSTSVSREEWLSARSEDGDYTARYVIAKVREQSKFDRDYTDTKHKLLLAQIDRLYKLSAFNTVAIVVVALGAIFFR